MSVCLFVCLCVRACTCGRTQTRSTGDIRFNREEGIQLNDINFVRRDDNQRGGKFRKCSQLGLVIQRGLGTESLADVFWAGGRWWVAWSEVRQDSRNDESSTVLVLVL